MKKMYLLAAVLLLLATNTVSYLAGSYQKDLQSEKDYQAACVLNDCCRNMVDNIGVDAEEIYKIAKTDLEPLYKEISTIKI